MKILQVVPYFPPAYAFGGPVKVAYQVSRELVKKKHEVVVYTSDAGDFGSRLRIDSDNNVDGIKVHYFRNFALTPVKKFKLFITPQLVSRAKEEVEKFDVIHLHEYRTFQNIVIAHYAKKYGVPYVLQAHGSLSRIMAKRMLKWIYDVLFAHKLLRDASKVIALSQVEAEQYCGMGVPEEKIEVLPNGIDLSKYGDLPPKGSFKMKFSIDDDEKIVVYLGRIHKSKGLDLLAKAFSIAVKKLKNVRLVVVGPNDGYAPSFVELASRLKIENNLLLTGFVTEEEKMAALTDSDVFVTPCYSGFPATFLEASVTGTPIITTNRADELKWIRDKAGLVVEYSPMKVAEAILFLLTNEDVAMKMGNEARQLVSSNFSIERVVNKLEQIYEGVVGG